MSNNVATQDTVAQEAAKATVPVRIYAETQDMLIRAKGQKMVDGLGTPSYADLIDEAVIAAFGVEGR